MREFNVRVHGNLVRLKFTTPIQPQSERKQILNRCNNENTRRPKPSRVQGSLFNLSSQSTQKESSDQSASAKSVGSPAHHLQITRTDATGKFQSVILLALWLPRSGEQVTPHRQRYCAPLLTGEKKKTHKWRGLMKCWNLSDEIVCGNHVNRP